MDAKQILNRVLMIEAHAQSLLNEAGEIRKELEKELNLVPNQKKNKKESSKEKYAGSIVRAIANRNKTIAKGRKKLE
jgi:hypothetical protein